MEMMRPDAAAAEACVVLVTCASREEAESIARAIISEKLAACVNMMGENGGLTSFYRWESALQEASEVLLLIKTQANRLPELERRIQELHSYTVPEFLVLPVLYGSASYLDWIRQSID
jgi:periplasmic divalent cation tolerance protein